MASNLQVKKTLLDEHQIGRAVRRMAGEIVERNRGVAGLMLVGIRTRGVPLAERLAAEIERMEGSRVAMGVLDITLYRDDLSTIGPQPVVRETAFAAPVESHLLVLCDDVLYTGRTVRAALDALVDWGRPRAVQLAVLVDRGWRELPIQADFVGMALRTTASEVVKVSFAETDAGKEAVELLDRPQADPGNEGHASQGNEGHG